MQSTADPLEAMAEPAEGGLDGLEEIKGELQRLRQKMGVTGGNPAESSAGLSSQPVQLTSANLPAEVPELPTFCMVTPDMMQTKHLLATPAATCEIAIWTTETFAGWPLRFF